MTRLAVGCGLVALCLMLLCAGPIGCQKEEGPLEKAGKKADSLLEKAGDASRDVAEKVREGASK